ncbi:MAG: apolipoprotein N-acyltransferase [Candidatus Omnitrophota bacterium]
MLKSILSALILYLSLPNYFFHYGLGPLAWIFAVPLFFALEDKGPFQRMVRGWLFGLFFFGLALSWLATYNVLAYGAFVLLWSLQPLFFSFLYSPRDKHRAGDLFLIPALWATAEFTYSQILNGFSWTIGHSQAFNVPAIQIANLFGSYGISFFIIFFNYALFRAMKDPRERRFHFTAAALSLLILFGYGFFSLLEQRNEPFLKNYLRIGIIQPNIRPQEIENPLAINQIIAKHLSLTEDSLPENPEMIIWPETTIPDDFLLQKPLREKVTQAAARANTYLLVGAALLRDGRDYNSAVLLDPNGNVADVYDKRFLVPFIEYSPGGKRVRDLQKFLKATSYDFLGGARAGILSLRQNRSAKEIIGAVTICSEDHYPSLFRQFSSRGTKFAVVMLNDSWSPRDEAMIIHAPGSILRAVENGLAVVRIANTGWSCFIDKYGRISPKNTLPLNSRGFIVRPVCLADRKTLYTRIGDIFAVLCLTFVIINYLLKIFQKKE